MVLSIGLFACWLLVGPSASPAAEQSGDGWTSLTVYPEGKHNVWNEAYDDERLIEWFLANRRGKKAVMPPSAEPVK